MIVGLILPFLIFSLAAWSCAVLCLTSEHSYFIYFVHVSKYLWWEGNFLSQFILHGYKQKLMKRHVFMVVITRGFFGSSGWMKFWIYFYFRSSVVLNLTDIQLTSLVWRVWSIFLLSEFSKIPYKLLGILTSSLVIVTFLF